MLRWQTVEGLMVSVLK